ncbi:uncharacterized protein T551_03105 [Pneumocystis jirovecii RU7]|uniref:Major surface glycoprotein 2 C-terminal domain-containing protein n=1 Tax=Pneumocystis jirovecii (strain RU7) TaxID=1408657 RepID=A0A0W4ZGW3_PNEJ7|nr:uncharacterized protein T551_03105 [Pneumocystis jirovecii RU7]KTW27606.1 hypothetical protein T551_03105 [Pneumocystis jirovecii RU7]
MSTSTQTLIQTSTHTSTTTQTLTLTSICINMFTQTLRVTFIITLTPINIKDFFDKRSISLTLISEDNILAVILKETVDNEDKLCEIKLKEKKRDEVAEVLLRALRENLKEGNRYEKSIANKCQELSEESDELIKLAETRCKDLEMETDLLTRNQNKSEETCYLLLEKCYFYRPACKKDLSKCDDLKKECEKIEIVYISPDSDFDPTKFGTGLVEKIGLKDLYEKAGEKEICIKKPPIKEKIALLSFLVDNITIPSTINTSFKDKCKDQLMEKCKNFEKHKILGNVSKEKNNYGVECEEFDKYLKNIIGALSLIIDNKQLFQDQETVRWGKLPRLISDNDCAWLKSNCFYYQKYYNLNKRCRNAKVACYKSRLVKLANEMLHKKMQGMLQGSNRTWLEKLQKKLIDVCQELIEKSNEIFLLCMEPKRGAFILLTDFRRAIFLRKNLNKKRDFPTKKECRELEKSCEILEQDSKEIKYPCHTLKQNYDWLSNAEMLEEKLLEKKLGNLKNETNCKEEIKKRCKRWFRTGNNMFFPAYSALNLSCKKISENIKSKCTALKRSMKNHNIVDNATNNNTMEETCTLWTPYCDRFTPSCSELEDGTDDGECKKLNEKCKLFYEKKKLQNKLINELKGSLSNNNDCTAMLNKYCMQSTDKINVKTFAQARRIIILINLKNYVKN